MTDLKTKTINGRDLVQWLFDMMLDFTNPLDLFKRIHKSKIIVIDFALDGHERTGFLLLPNDNKRETKDLEQIIMKGIEQGKTSEQLNAEIALFNAKCGNAQ